MLFRSNANGVLTNAEIDKLTGSHIRNEDVINSDLQRKDGNDNYLYTYFGHPVTISGGSKVKAIRVDNALKVTKQTTYSGYLLDNIKLTVDNIRIKSELDPLSVVVDQQLGSSVFNPLADEISTTYLFKFYTYTKDDLTISLSGELQKAEYSVSQMGTLDNAMFVNDKDLALVEKINKGDVEDGEVLTFAGGEIGRAHV